MVIEFWHKGDSRDDVIGLTKISLHQFYLAYRNPVILKYLTKNRLPVTGTDWWEPIHTPDNQELLGQVQILAALGTEAQINNLKSDRGFADNYVKARVPAFKQTILKKTLSSELKLNNKCATARPEKRNLSIQTISDHYVTKKNNFKSNGCSLKLDVATQADIVVERKVKAAMDEKDRENVEDKQADDKSNPAHDMFGVFLSQLVSQRQRNVFVENSTNTDASPLGKTDDGKMEAAQVKTNLELKKTNDLLESLQKALTADKLKKLSVHNGRPGCFRANISINSANHLPSRKKCKSRKSRNRSVKHEENILPSCYVSFETLPEESLKVTSIAMRTTSPTWDYRCDVNLPIDLLQNNQKRLIFKVWRKSNNTVTSPNVQADTVIGFAAVDLTILLAGLPNIQGWFNIVDFSGKCNGQINIHITPLENINRFQTRKDCECNEKPTTQPASFQPEQDETPAEPSEMLSRALKRKFSELDEITQRLRLRLSKVTKEDSDASSDGFADEFERDINSLCIEEDFDLINFEEGKEEPQKGTEGGGSGSRDFLLVGDESQKDIGVGSSSSTLDPAIERLSSELSVDIGKDGDSITSLDRHLLTGKQQISSLLEKLTLLSAESNPFQSRYVSGCSTTDTHSNTKVDTEAILKVLDHESRPNIQSSILFSQERFDEIYSSGGETAKKSDTPRTTDSDTSVITNFSDCRLAPDGQGNGSDEPSVTDAE